jgi:hypothetical protein
MSVRAAIIVCIILSTVHCAVADSNSYFACSGYSGTSAMQDLIPLENRTITAAKSEENGSISVSAKQIEVEGIPLMSGTYDICESTDQVLTFSPACYPGETDKLKDYGVFNKVTGVVRYHVGDLLFILNCRKAEKLLK